MKLPLIAVLTLPLAACSVEREVSSTTIVSSVTPEQQRACANAAASARGVAPEFATPASASATPTGPLVLATSSAHSTSARSWAARLNSVSAATTEPT